MALARCLALFSLERQLPTRVLGGLSCAAPRFFGTSPATRASDSTDGAASAPAYTITDAPVTERSARQQYGRSVVGGIRGHTKKLNPLARQIVGLSVPEAMAQMSFGKQKRAATVKTAIERACWNADFYHNLTRDNLMVDRAWTGKELCSPRIRHHSKGRAGMAHWRTSKLTVKLRPMSPEEKEKLVKFPTLPSAETRGKLVPRGY